MNNRRNIVVINRKAPRRSWLVLALDRAQRGSVQFLTFMSQYICHATWAGRKAGRLSTNTAQSLDRLSTNKPTFTNTILKEHKIKLFYFSFLWLKINTPVLRMNFLTLFVPDTNLVIHMRKCMGLIIANILISSNTRVYIRGWSQNVRYPIPR